VRRVLIVSAIVGLAVLSPGIVGAAPAVYTWSVDGSTANSGLPAGLAPGIELGPNVASAKGGERLEIAGVGKFTPKGHWIDGGGDYRVVDAAGTVVASGRWRPTRLAGYRDLGAEPEGSPYESLRSGIIVAPIDLQGLGTGRLTFLCGAHARDGSELEGVNVTTARWTFNKVESGSTTIETS